MQKLNSTSLRISNPSEEEVKKIKRNDIYVILDNVLDTYNIGAVFRLADAVAAKKIYLCQGSETPPNSRIQKASIGTWQWVPWEHCSSASDAIQSLKKNIPEVSVVGIELTDESISYDEFDYPLPIAFVIGHETDGISEETLQKCDKVVQLPMFGVNISLNTMVSLGIVLYEAIEKNSL